MKNEKLEPRKFYHILTRSVSEVEVFKEEENYFFFLEKYKKYIHPVAETWAHALIGNHFHFVLRIRSEKAICAIKTDFRGLNENDFSKKISQQFSNLLNSYAQAYNKLYQRHGSLFQNPFKRQEIKSKMHLQNCITYANRNPVHHSFCNRIEDWSFTSYEAILSDKPTLLNRKGVLQLNNNASSFIDIHKNATSSWLHKMEEEFESSS
ncbi:MAG: hypothetical protein JXQ87_00095 [Bacteroidia bacterium]